MKIAQLFLVLAATALLGRSLHAEMADGVQAIVNDTVITYAQVAEYTAPVAETLRRQYAGQPDAFEKALNDALKDSLEQLIERQLILHSFETDGYKLPDSVVDDMFQEEMRNRFGDRVTMIKTLQAQGITVEQFRKQVRERFIESEMRRLNVSREVIISPYKVQNYYQAHQAVYGVEDEIKLRMITLNKGGSEGTNTVRLANEILSEIKKGATFQEMAMVYSQDAQQHQGGDRGWVERPVLRKELADAAFALKPGETGVVDLPEACYLLNVEEIRLAHVKPLAEVRDEIEKTLRTEEQARLEKQWMDSLRKKTFVVLLGGL